MVHRERELRLVSVAELTGHCTRALLNARAALNCTTSESDATEYGVNAHLIELLTVGLTRRHVELPAQVSDWRQALARDLPPHQRRHRVWHVGATCLFMAGLRFSPRATGGETIRLPTHSLLCALGQQAYSLAADLEQRAWHDRRGVPQRLAERFLHYVELVHQTSLNLGFVPSQLRRPLKALLVDDVLNAWIDFARSPSLAHWHRLQVLVGQHRQLNPKFTFMLPPAPEA